MCNRNSVPVWIGIILLSGMFLMGQESWPPQGDLCDPDPCLSIPDAVPNSCEGVGGGEFTCDCEAGYFWEEIGDTCEGPCELDPCDAINDAVAGSCTGISADEFTCDCNAGFYWSDDTNTCERAMPPCVPDPCQGITNGIPGTCEVIPGGACAPSIDFTCDCLTGFLWDESSNTCEAGGVPQFTGGIYNIKAAGLAQDPAYCVMGPVWFATINAFIKTLDPILVGLPSSDDILALQESGNPYPLTIILPAFGSVRVLLTLDETYDTILMDGPDVYIVDTTGLLPWTGADCVITGSADGVFDDINSEPLTGSLTIAIDSVEAPSGGACNIMKNPEGDCDLKVILDAGSPIR